MAGLELSHEGAVALEQETTFGAIAMRRPGTKTAGDRPVSGTTDVTVGVEAAVAPSRRRTSQDLIATGA